MDGLSLSYNSWGFSCGGSHMGRQVWLALSLLMMSTGVAGLGLDIQSSSIPVSGAGCWLWAGAPQFSFT